MTRTQKILGGVLLVQALLLVAMNLSTFTGAAATRESHALLPVLDSITPAKISIADAADETVILERKDDGWVLPGSGDYPVPADKVTDLINTLKDIEVRRSVVSSSRYHAALKVTSDEFERRVQVWANAADDADVELLIGTSPNYRITHVRNAGSDEVYEAMAFSASQIRADVSSWIDKKFIDVPFNEITAIEVSNASGAFELQKENGTWSIASPASARDKVLDSSKVDTFVRSVATMWLIDPVGPVDEAAQGLAEPAARIALTRTPPPPPVEVTDTDGETDTDGDTDGDGETDTDGEADDESAAPAEGPVEQPQSEVIEYRIGAQKDEDSGYRYVARNGFDFTVTVSKYDAEKALDKKLDDLLQEETTDTATDG